MSSEHPASIPLGSRSYPLFTIYIPTYNRAALLPTAFASLAEQTLRDFEVLVIDDGSTDDTRTVVESWRAKGLYPLRYIWQENQGMHASHNTAIEHAQGELTMRLDSDDSLLPDALEKIKRRWQAIPQPQRQRFAGISGLCLNDDGTISGDPYPRDPLDSDYLEIITHCRMNGERRDALRTDVWREFPYPRIGDEKRLRSSLVLLRLAHRYKVRFVNDVLQINRHAVGGITGNRFKYRMRYPKGQRLYYLEAVTLHHAYSGPRRLYGQYIHYVRYSLHCGVGWRQQADEVRHKLLWSFALPPGVYKWLRDRWRLRRNAIN